MSFALFNKKKNTQLIYKEKTKTKTNLKEMYSFRFVCHIRVL